MDNRSISFTVTKQVQTNAEMLKAFDRFVRVKGSGIDMSTTKLVCKSANITEEQYKFIVKWFNNLSAYRSSVSNYWLYEQGN